MVFLIMILTSSPILSYLPLHAFIISVLFGAIFLLISYLLLIGFQKIDINIGSILVSTELIFGPFFAFLLFREILTDLEIFGAILTIVAVLIINLNFKKK